MKTVIIAIYTGGKGLYSGRDLSCSARVPFAEQGPRHAIIKGIIGLAHNLGFRATAEGFETEQQLEFLTERSSDEIQGFHYYRPVPAEELEAILKRSG